MKANDNYLGLVKRMSIKLGDIRTRVIKEKDGSYAISCSVLGVYTVGRTLAEAKKNFGDALERIRLC
jgi:hypothetical protein